MEKVTISEMFWARLLELGRPKLLECEGVDLKGVRFFLEKGDFFIHTGKA